MILSASLSALGLVVPLLLSVSGAAHAQPKEMPLAVFLVNDRVQSIWEGRPQR
jgi:hypothetical protein